MQPGGGVTIQEQQSMTKKGKRINAVAKGHASDQARRGGLRPFRHFQRNNRVAAQLDAAQESDDRPLADAIGGQ